MTASHEPAHRETGDVLFKRHLYVAAAEAWRHWLELAEESRDPAQMIGPLNALTVLYTHRKEPEVALSLSDRAVDFLADGLASVWEFRTRLNRIGVLQELGRLDDALAEAHRAEMLLPEVKAPTLASGFWLEVCVIHYRRQEWVPMRRTAHLAEAAASRAGYELGQARATLNLGIAHQELGLLKLAERDLNRSLRMFERFDPSSVAYVRTELGRLQFARGNYAEALEQGRLALSALLLDVAALDKEEVAKLSSLFGTIFGGAGQRILGLKYHNRAAAYYSQLGLVADWRRATDAVAGLLTLPTAPIDTALKDESFKLDFLTNVLDLTDDIESVDPYLRGHSERVASLALILGQRVGLSDAQLYELNHAARLHDVGKVAVDAEILMKPGKLTESEYQRVKMHPVIGEEMLRPYALSASQLQAIRHHHERWGGGGYPDGIAGEQIPLLARIIAVADTYDAMTSNRVYRNALTHSEAIREMQLLAGEHLDPVLVRTFLAVHQV